MKFNSVDMIIEEDSIKNINFLEVVENKMLEKKNHMSEYLSIINILQNEKNTYKKLEIEDMIKLVNKELEYMRKLKSRANEYKKIKIKKEGDYDSSKEIIIFPIGTTKKFKKQWLINNEYPIKSIQYDINSMYDCTGKIHTVYVEYKANKVIITAYYDV